MRPASYGDAFSIYSTNCIRGPAGTYIALLCSGTRAQGEEKMTILRLKKLTFVAFVASVLLLIGSSDVNAQSRRELERQRQRIEREQRQIERERRSGSYRATERRINNSSYNSGYDQGFLAGQYDRRRGKYNQSNVYRGTGSAPYSGDPTSLDYLYRQGYLKGYDDGYYGRPNY